MIILKLNAWNLRSNLSDKSEVYLAPDQFACHDGGVDSQAFFGRCQGV